MDQRALDDIQIVEHYIIHAVEECLCDACDAALAAWERLSKRLVEETE